MWTNSLIAVYGCLMALVSLLWMSGRITQKQYAGWMASLDGVAAVACGLAGWTNVMYVHVAVTAWFVWMWWHSGGGDGPRRRFKAWAGRFQGVRRTAPSAAS